ncbi:MAG: RNA methyltransferase [Eubacteriales bacterium]
MREINSTANQTIKDICSLKTSKARADVSAFIVEGEKCVSEAFFVPDRVRMLIIDISYIKDYENYICMSEQNGTEVLAVAAHVFAKISSEKTPPKIAAVIKIETIDNALKANFAVALEDVQDPQNVGAILRTADAAGADTLILSYNCADVFSPKAVKASMGSIFHLNIVKADNIVKEISMLKQRGVLVLGAHPRQGKPVVYKKPACLVFGNEGHGMSEDMIDICDSLINIKMYGKAESLNVAVAAGILIFDSARAFNL